MPATIFVLAVLGALVAAGFLAALRELRAGRAALQLEQALGEAERAAALRLAGWDAGRFNALLPGDELADTVLGSSGAIDGLTRVRRLGAYQFLIMAESRGRWGARQTVGLLAALRVPTLPWEGPVYPVEADEAPARASAGSEGPTCRGSPPPRDVARGADSLASIVYWVARASKTVAPGVRDRVTPTTRQGRCATQEPMNWGDPRGRGSLCDDYLPVVYVPGDLTLLGGFGQGVLVVEGNLSVRGDLTLEGLVIVGRGLHAESTARIVGAVRVGARGHGVVRRTGEGRVEFSPCAVDRALTAIAPARPLSSRGWFLALE